MTETPTYRKQRVYGLPDGDFWAIMRGYDEIAIVPIGLEIEADQIVAALSLSRGEGEPIAWSYELALWRDNSGEWHGWSWGLSRYKPNVSPGSVRNLTPLYARPSPDATAIREECARLKNNIDSALNDYLCEMKEGYDDSIVGFNEAWDVVRKVFARSLNAGEAPGPKEPTFIKGAITDAYESGWRPDGFGGAPLAAAHGPKEEGK